MADSDNPPLVVNKISRRKVSNNVPKKETKEEGKKRGNKKEAKEDVEEEMKGKTRVVNMKGTKDRMREDIYIGRQCYMGGWKLEKSKWCNPYAMKGITREQSIKMYREYIMNQPELLTDLHELKGKKLGCWCYPEQCHGDVLVELAEEF